MNTVKVIFTDRKIKLAGLLVMLIYYGLYMWSINYLNLVTSQSLFKIRILSNWRELMLRRTSTFLFEPIGYLDLFKSVRLLIAPANMLLGLLLGGLVLINIASVLYMYKLPKQCRIDSKFNGLIGILPSFITGFACCLPSFILPLASLLGSSAAFFTSIFIWLLPLSIVLLLYGIVSSFKKINQFMI